MTLSKNNDGEKEASLFETISHVTRIRILFILNEGQLGFSELKHELGIKSSGNLQHHLGKLDNLIEINEGLYSLSDDGREAIIAIDAVRRMQNRKQHDRIIITMVYAFSLYAGFMNVPFLTGTVNPTTPLMALGIAMFASIIFYLGWSYVIPRHERKQAVSEL